MVEIAYVNIWDKRVGVLAWDSERAYAAFEYEPDFIDSGLELAPLSMPLHQGPVFSFPRLPKETFKGLPGLLADSLPDKYGNALINQWLVRNNRAVNSINPLESLCFIGSRGMGALEFKPALPSGSKAASNIELDELIAVASKILGKRTQFQTQFSGAEEKAVRDMIRIGTSAGGARAKAVVAYNRKSGEIRSGQGSVPKGFEHYLIKFDGVADEQLGVSHGYGRVEYAYYHMARQAGIDIMDSELLEENGRAHFLTKRFDRLQDGAKVHVQTFCAMQHYDFQEVGLYTYEDLFETMRMLGLPYPEAEQMFRRMLFNILARNCDDHTKNFAFTMSSEGKWTLAPAYDICHAYRPDSIWVSQHCLSVNGKRKDINRADLLTFAKAMNIKKAAAIIEEVQSVVSNWMQFADSAKVDEQLASAINETLVQLD